MWVNIPDQYLRLVAARVIEDVPQLAADINEHVESQNDPDYAAIVKAAEDTYVSEDIEIDDGAIISRGDTGAFVMAWVYVNDEEAGIGEDK